ncbi:hypothetical protein B9Z55_007635 [Caenorhabditis nigoni]|uniref:Uncharacterized protein n=1 Tax=Caenorhabditis nigoni TaxID=1611254 RepID=A0A2G5VAH2_9PELO|nr:hypothetical protein B9Z55_007635 [Caenorhabditis nigoni]
MPYSKEFNKFYVNGVDMESDDYTSVLNMDMPCSMSVCERLFRSTACAKEMGAICRRDSPSTWNTTNAQCRRRLTTFFSQFHFLNKIFKNKMQFYPSVFRLR